MAENLRYDVDGYEVVTKALWDLVNDYPALNGDTISFADTAEERGKAFIPTSGAVIQSEIKDVTGNIEQTCIYPFMVIYKATNLSETSKVNVKEWLDNLGRWLERQTVVINGEEMRLEKYPTLTRGREMKKIERTSPSYLSDISDKNVETWAISLQAQYTNEFDL